MKGFWDSLFTVLQVIALVFLLILWDVKSLTWWIASLALFFILLAKFLLWLRVFISNLKR